jgi:hypothetical protein
MQRSKLHTVPLIYVTDGMQFSYSCICIYHEAVASTRNWSAWRQRGYNTFTVGYKWKLLTNAGFKESSYRMIPEDSSKVSVCIYEVWSKISGTKFFIEKLLIVSKWQPCRILDNISWRHIPEERMVTWLSREWVHLQCNRVCPSVVLWNGCVEGATCLHHVLPETW